ncbi:MAG: hypothetical protein WAO35_05585 [Terriglobia bacterium]
MPGEKTAIPVWQENLQRWDSLEGGRLRALLFEYAPHSAFPGSPSYTIAMLAALCPRESVSGTSPDELRRKLAKVSFEHKASTPYDDDEYWLAQGPFDGKFYVFASMPGAGWPYDPVYVLEARPAWFDED